MYKHIYSEGFTTKVMDHIERHRKTEDVFDSSDAFMVNPKVRKSRRITTQGLDFLVRWRYGSKS